jgi:hypothetical protein
MFEQSGPTTTPYEEGKTIEPCVRVFKLNENFVPQPLPKSTSKWTPHEFLSDIVGDELLNSIPTIGIKSGATDYLDLVRPDEFIDSEGKHIVLMKGMDVFERHFVTFGVKASGENINDKFYIYTVFRRYSSPSSGWVLCKSHYSFSSGHIVETVLNSSPTIGSKGRELLRNFFATYKDNKGIEGVAEVFNNDTDDFVEKKFTLTFYPPMEKEKEKE